ncbi:CaiB/BaiF CoA transferase family protein [Arachidicoccus sp.]|uniref:CaiB/BaiF CoA transferase family protein n=1 Tax=Arachidicoccus sp. TaxID=1872624 RepID=UPI003D1C20F4
MYKPLEDILIIDFSQFLSGPSASLRLADLGARVIKIEKPLTGDISRHMYISNVEMNGASSVFHAINRNKESFTADLKSEIDKNALKELIKRADIVMHNFRPGVMERLGFDYPSVKAIKDDIIYGEISGYGTEGPWKFKPGQDLLLQALSGICWLSGNEDMAPVPMGISLVDIAAGAHLAQGLLACLYRKGINGEGGLVQVSMLESACDLQFESLTTFFNDGNELPKRTKTSNANAYLGAPYGIYKTRDGYLSLAMGSIPILAGLINCPSLSKYKSPASWYKHREEIKEILEEFIMGKTTEHWLAILEPADIWCAEVLTWDKLMEHEGFKKLNMVQKVEMKDGYNFLTTSCPIIFDNETLLSSKGTPKLGEDNEAIAQAFLKQSFINEPQ